jgi:hypothetical protein
MDSAVEIREARSETEEADAAELMGAHLSWGAQLLREQYGIDEAPADPTQVRAGLDTYRGPRGCLLVAYSGGRPVGEDVAVHSRMCQPLTLQGSRRGRRMSR